MSAVPVEPVDEWPRHRCGATMRPSAPYDHAGTTPETHPWFCTRCLVVVTSG